MQLAQKNIIRMQEREGFKAIYFSTSEVYGDFEKKMSENVMDKFEIKQMNDYALSKWVNEQQVLNSAHQFNTKSVNQQLFNTSPMSGPTVLTDLFMSFYL